MYFKLIIYKTPYYFDLLNFISDFQPHICLGTMFTVVNLNMLHGIDNYEKDDSYGNDDYGNFGYGDAGGQNLWLGL